MDEVIDPVKCGKCGDSADGDKKCSCSGKNDDGTEDMGSIKCKNCCECDKGCSCGCKE